MSLRGWHPAPPIPPDQEGGPPPAKKQKLRPCAACARSKVKCDNKKPACGRCVRLGLACVDAAPSRRGTNSVRICQATAERGAASFY